MRRMVTAGRTVIGRLAMNDDLLLGLGGQVEDLGIRLGEVSAIGAVGKARVGFYDQAARKYCFHDLDRPLEILSLTGNISMKDGAPFVHAHVVLSDSEGIAYGGHLFEGTTVFACEFVIRELCCEEPPARVYDEATGLFLWPFERG